MGMKKKLLSAALCAARVGTMLVPAGTVQAADDTIVYWSMWEATEPQGKVIQEAVDAYMEETGVKREDMHLYVDEIAAMLILQRYMDGSAETRE